MVEFSPRPIFSMIAFYDAACLTREPEREIIGERSRAQAARQNRIACQTDPCRKEGATDRSGRVRDAKCGVVTQAASGFAFRFTDANHLLTAIQTRLPAITWMTRFRRFWL